MAGPFSFAQIGRGEYNENMDEPKESKKIGSRGFKIALLVIGIIIILIIGLVIFAVWTALQLS